MRPSPPSRILPAGRTSREGQGRALFLGPSGSSGGKKPGDPGQRSGGERSPFGWEILERRCAGLADRLKYFNNLLEQHVADPSIRIEEFEAGLFHLNRRKSPVKTGQIFQRNVCVIWLSLFS